MTRRNPKADFRDLSPREAYQLTERLRAEALYLENGRIVGIRNPELLATYIELGTQTFKGLAKEWIASRRAALGDGSSELKKDEAGQKISRSPHRRRASNRS